MPKKDTASERIREIFNEQSLFMDRADEVPFIRRKNLSPEKTAAQERKFHLDYWKREEKWTNEKGETVRAFQNISLRAAVDVTEHKDGSFSLQPVHWLASHAEEKAFEKLLPKLLAGKEKEIPAAELAATGREMWEHHNFILRRDAGGAMTAVILFDPPVYKIPKGTPVAAGVRASDIVKPEGWEPTGTPFEWKPANPALPVQELVWSLQNQGLGWREDAQRMANDAALYNEVRSALNDSEKERKVWARQHRIKL